MQSIKPSTPSTETGVNTTENVSPRVGEQSHVASSLDGRTAEFALEVPQKLLIDIMMNEAIPLSVRKEMLVGFSIDKVTISTIEQHLELPIPTEQKAVLIQSALQKFYKTQILTESKIAEYAIKHELKEHAKKYYNIVIDLADKHMPGIKKLAKKTFHDAKVIGSDVVRDTRKLVSEHLPEVKDTASDLNKDRKKVQHKIGKGFKKFKKRWK